MEIVWSHTHVCTLSLPPLLHSFHSIVPNVATSPRPLQVPVSPYMDTNDAHTLVVKNKNMEGGLGIYFYKNAVFGGRSLSPCCYLRLLSPASCL